MISCRAIGGMCSRFCASVPSSRIVGPSIVRPKLPGAGALIARISWESAAWCARSSPPPPYSTGHPGAAQPWVPRARTHSSKRFRESRSRDPTRTSSGQFSASQSRASPRNDSTDPMTDLQDRCPRTREEPLLYDLPRPDDSHVQIVGGRDLRERREKGKREVREVEKEGKKGDGEWDWSSPKTSC